MDPIEWKIEEQYKKNKKNKDDVPVKDFRTECREFAKKWIKIHIEEFRRLGVTGDFENYYSTMSFSAEAQIVRELVNFCSKEIYIKALNQYCGLGREKNCFSGCRGRIF